MTSVSGERLYQTLTGRIRNKAVLAGIRRLPREKFLDRSMLPFAGDDSALPIGFEQTTSAPFVIARMLEMMFADSKPAGKILEVGCGCGYQTALLAEMGCEVIGIERVRQLADTAARRLRDLGYETVSVIHGDGFLGDSENAPFDGIVVCAECDSVPPRLLAQLASSARLVLPLRDGDEVRLTAINAKGSVVAVREHVRFVNMQKGAV